MRCEAKSKQSGQRCRKSSRIGRNVCHIHGGATPRGLASSSFKHGKKTKDLPTRLAIQFEENLDNPNLLSMREDIALLDARLSDLLGRVDMGESGALWERLKKEWTSYNKARAGGDPKRIKEAHFSVEQAIEAGKSDHDAWGEIRDWLEQRRKLSESERKRLVDMQQMVKADQAMTLVAAVAASVRTHVRDRDALSAIYEDIRRISQNTGDPA